VFNPEFIKSAQQPGQFPADSGSEVAFAGRSNSGKSSAINAILGHGKLARTSKTPGRTQLVNFFGVAPDRRVVDLPGYGFARVPPAVQRHWRSLLEGYFRRRRSLRGLVITVDIRRGLTDLDRQMLSWAEPIGIPVLLLLTKADKLSRGAAQTERRRVAAAAPEGAALVVFSAVDRQGVPEARERLTEWLGLEEGGNKETPGAGFRGHTRG
jgi:GTP-binding protein